jgi:Domain of unknown function (DUF1906)
MSTRFGVDEDWQRLAPAQLLAVGKTFAIGYVSEDNTGKNITAAEIQGYLDAGVAVLLVYEYSTTAISGGAAKGRRDALIACQHAISVEYPWGCTIAFAVDENTSGNPSAIDDYCYAFTAMCHDHGFYSMVYGGLSTVKRALDLGMVDFAWQTYAWSGNPVQWDPRVAIRQTQNGVTINGKTVDLDTAMIDDFGLWEAEMPSLDDPQGGRLYNANAYLDAIVNLHEKAKIASNNNSTAIIDWDIKFVTTFLTLVDTVNGLVTAVGALTTAVSNISATSLSAEDKTTIDAFTVTVNALTAHLK